jgi:hypothetical protein
MLHLRSILVTILLLVSNKVLLAQAEYFAAGIQKDNLKAHLSVLTSDSLAGRETGTEGNLKATEYIARHFEKIGIPPSVNHSYFQNIVFTSESFVNNKVMINEKEYAPMWDFYSFPSFNTDLDLRTNEVVFLGYGIDDPVYSDYKRVDTQGKIILIYDEEPFRSDSTSWLTGNTSLSEWTTDVTKKIAAAKKNGVKAVLIIDGRLQKNISKYRNTYLNTSMQVGKNDKISELYSNCFYISTTMAKAIIGNKFDDVVAVRNYIANKGRTKHIKLETSISLFQKKNVKQLDGRNVLGYIEGSDKKMKEELVVVTAHLDHLGQKGNNIYRGADDDGSGTCAVLEIARAFAEAKKKGQGARRSVLCMLVTGEEKGLLGSSFYTSFPVFPLEKTIVDVNIDMIGRVDAEHMTNQNYIYVIGADKLSTELHQINEMMNQNYTKLDLDYRYNDENEPNRYYYRSDHYNFVKSGIPAIFYFNGTHEDYHRPTDTIDKINFDLLTKRTKLAFYTAWELANRPERIKIDVKQ